MAKKGTKIKRYGSIYERKNGSVILALTMLAGLVIFGIAGWLLYTPVHDFIMGLGAEEQPSVDVAESSQTVSENASSTTSSQPEQQETVNAEKEIKAIFLTAEQLLDENALDAALKNAASSGINTVVVDGKDSSGTVLYSSSNEVAKSSGVAAASVYDAAKISAAIKKSGLSPAVRLHAFKDAAAPAADRDMAVHYYDTDIYWLDNSPELGGKMWLNPYSDKTQGYILSLIEELCSAGFETVMLDSVQFPSGVGLDKAGYGENAKTVSKSQLLNGFVKKATEAAESNGAQLLLCTDDMWLAPGAENYNIAVYGGSPVQFFTDKIVVSLPDDSSVWESRAKMIMDNTQSEIIVAAKAFAEDGTPLDSGLLMEQLSSIGSDGFILYDPLGKYKFN